MAVKKRVTVSGHLEVLAFWFSSIVITMPRGSKLARALVSLARKSAHICSSTITFLRLQNSDQRFGPRNGYQGDA
jgi:hypothetical protein